MKTLAKSTFLFFALLILSCHHENVPNNNPATESTSNTNQRTQNPPPPPIPSAPQKVKSINYSEDLDVAPAEMHVLKEEFKQKRRDIGNGNLMNREGYEFIKENEFLAVINEPLSTFSIDVDRASYSNCRRYLQSGSLPPASAVRIEEFVNYFDYDYNQPKGEEPFSITTELAACPWNNGNKLLHIGLQGRNIGVESLPPANLVFLLDVSGSMNNFNKLPLLKKAFQLLINQLRPQDKVSIVVYAGSSGVVLPATSCAKKEVILDALNNLSAGGSTAGGQGIKLAYNIAKDNFLPNGNNRVILATDGDFNVGVSSDGELVRLIEKEREFGVFLSILGFGTGNYQDAKMEKLADNGNGNYNYIDNIKEARKVLVNEIGATLHTIAKDVKLQLEFNPNQVESYRLLGYENRVLRNEDFNNDSKDAGDIGAGHSVTAVYEIVPKQNRELTANINQVDPLKYSNDRKLSNAAFSKEWATIKFRYKKPDSDNSKLITKIASLSQSNNVSNNYKLAAGLINFGMLLKKSKFADQMNYDMALDLIKSTELPDKQDRLEELKSLIQKAKSLSQMN